MVAGRGGACDGEVRESAAQRGERKGLRQGWRLEYRVQSPEYRVLGGGHIAGADACNVAP